MERKTNKLIKCSKQIALFFFVVIIGFSIAILVESLDLSNLQYFYANFLYNFLKFFFEEIEVKNENIFIKNVNFIITVDCLMLKPLIIISVVMLFYRKYSLLIKTILLLFVQNFFRIIFEIFLILEFSINLDLYFSNFQNIVQTFLILGILLISNNYGCFKLRNKRIFNFL
ncbi:MAG: hypothetical protein QW197_02025 [Candidatus Aenigmatarchaeota archaeon]